MPTIVQEEFFENKVAFVGQRIKTCQYRFFKLIQLRKKQIPRISQEPASNELLNQVREKILKCSNEYINCLRSHHRGGQIPEYLTESARKFKENAYTHLAPLFVLQKLRLQIAEQIFKHNYKV